MFTPNGSFVSLRVSRIATRNASGEGCVRAVRTPEGVVHQHFTSGGMKRVLTQATSV